MNALNLQPPLDILRGLRKTLRLKYFHFTAKDHYQYLHRTLAGIGSLLKSNRLHLWILACLTEPRKKSFF